MGGVNGGDPPKDLPLEPRPDAQPFSAEVIDLGGMRIKFGLTRESWKLCQHRNMVYSTAERRIWCEDCERTIDNFDALYEIIKKFQVMESDVSHKNRKADEALKSTVVRRAAKVLDHAWMGKMAPCCPHCRSALLPEDFESGARMSVSREIEEARRRKAKEPK